MHTPPQLRSFTAIAASYAVNGLPQCSCCQESFVSWRHFRIHLKRNCCQALADGPMSSDFNVRMMMHYQDEQTPMQARHLSLLMTKPYGADLLNVIHRRAWQELVELRLASKDLSQYCVLCGQFRNRPQELNQHLKTFHGQWTLHVFTKANAVGTITSLQFTLQILWQVFPTNSHVPGDDSDFPAGGQP